MLTLKKLLSNWIIIFLLFIFAVRINTCFGISRDKVISIASDYANHSWYCSSDNASGCGSSTNCPVSGSAFSKGYHTGVAYQWGGFDSIENFDRKLSEGYTAGDVTGTICTSSCATGVDCSGFVSRCWGLTSKHSTSTLHNVSSEISKNNIKKGDIYNKKGSHVVLFDSFSSSGTPFIYESVYGYPHKVYYHESLWSYLDGYVPRKFNNIEESGIVLTKGLWIFENDGGKPIEYGQWMDAQFTVKNKGSSSITFEYIGIGGRAPFNNGGSPDSTNIYDLGLQQNITLQAGEEKIFFYKKDNFGKNNIWGTYQFTAVYKLSNKSWADIPPGESGTTTKREFQVVKNENAKKINNNESLSDYVPRKGFDHYYIDVPTNAEKLEIQTYDAASGNYLDLYEVKGSSYPTLNSYDHKSDTNLSNEKIIISNPSSGRHSILVHGYYSTGSKKGTTYKIIAKYTIITSDSTSPELVISSHNDNEMVNSNTITLKGTATDSGKGNNGIKKITVNGNRAINDNASGSQIANWYKEINLQSGRNNVEVSAYDNKDNRTTKTISILYDSPDNIGPNLTILSHNNGDNVSESNILLKGSASDSGYGNNGISKVTVNGYRTTNDSAVGSNTANWSVNFSLSPGNNELNVCAYDLKNNLTTKKISIYYNTPDNSGPDLTILSHNNGDNISESNILLKGRASDSGYGNNGISKVTVNGYRAINDYATGTNTANWSVNFSLSPGNNELNVCAYDLKNNLTTKKISIYYNVPDNSGPGLTILSHNNGDKLTESNILLKGSASDSNHGNNGITKVTVNGVRAASDTSSGSNTANWYKNIILNKGQNYYTICAYDQQNNQSIQTISLFYDPEDNSPPDINILSHIDGEHVVNSIIVIKGNATDSGFGDNGISKVTINNNRAANDSTSGSNITNWYMNLILNQGENIFSICAYDNSVNNNQSTKTLRIYYDVPDEECPVITIISHSNNEELSLSNITLAGTASDFERGNNGISKVTINGIRAAGDTALYNNTANWYKQIILKEGKNDINIVAYDNSESKNMTVKTLSLFYLINNEIVDPFTLDIDSNSKADALTDGLLIIRYMFGLNECDSLIKNAVDIEHGKRITETQINEYIKKNIQYLDIDDNGKSDALTDGIMIIRFLFGLNKGQSLVGNAVDIIDGKRTEPEEISDYLEQLRPLPTF